MKSIFLENLHHAYARTDGTYAFPNSREGDMLRAAKKEIESLMKGLEVADAFHAVAVAERNQAWAQLDSGVIFEVVDATDDEQYFTLGLFLFKDNAMMLLDGDCPPYNDDNPDAVTIEVRQRTVGLRPHQWTKIAERTWVRNYDESDDAPDWKASSVKIFNA